MQCCEAEEQWQSNGSPQAHLEAGDGRQIVQPALHQKARTRLSMQGSVEGFAGPELDGMSFSSPQGEANTSDRNVDRQPAPHPSGHAHARPPRPCPPPTGKPERWLADCTLMYAFWSRPWPNSVAPRTAAKESVPHRAPVGIRCTCQGSTASLSSTCSFRHPRSTTRTPSSLVNTCVLNTLPRRQQDWQSGSSEAHQCRRPDS